MVINLSDTYEVGVCLNVDGKVVRLLARGQSLAYLEGGNGVCAWEVEEITDHGFKYPLTVTELATLRKNTLRNPEYDTDPMGIFAGYGEK